MLNVIAAEVKTITVSTDPLKTHSEIIRNQKRIINFQNSFIQQVSIHLYSLLLSFMIFIDLMLSGKNIKDNIFDRKYHETIKAIFVSLVLAMVIVLLSISESSDNFWSKSLGVSIIIISLIAMINIIKRLEKSDKFTRIITSVAKFIKNEQINKFVSDVSNLSTILIVVIIFVHILMVTHCLLRYNILPKLV